MTSCSASKIQVVACYHYDFLFLVFLFKKWDRMVFLKKKLTILKIKTNF
jgi:hypothetical protein